MLVSKTKIHDLESFKGNSRAKTLGWYPGNTNSAKSAVAISVAKAFGSSRFARRARKASRSILPVRVISASSSRVIKKPEMTKIYRRP